MSTHHRSASRLALAAAIALGAGGALAAADDGAADGSWHDHADQFSFMGFTATYSCDGLADKLSLLLTLSGARAGVEVAPQCSRGYGTPDPFAQATLKFASLQPATVASGAALPAVPGVWRHVLLAAYQPRELQPGDCELIEQFRDKLLPKFTVRNVQDNVHCIPHQQNSGFSLSFDVFESRDAHSSARDPAHS